MAVGVHVGGVYLSTPDGPFSQDDIIDPIYKQGPSTQGNRCGMEAPECLLKNFARTQYLEVSGLWPKM